MNINIRRLSIILIIMYFSIAPIYEQPLLSDNALSLLKVFILLSLVSVGLIWGASSKVISFGKDDGLFLLVISVASFYIIREQNLFGIFLLGYIFYFLGKIYVKLIGSNFLLSSIVIVARLSSLYSIYVLIVYLTNDLGDLVNVLNPNTWALYGAISISILLFNYSKSQSKIDLILTVPLVLSVAFSGSRGGLLNVFLIIFLLFFYQRNWKVIAGILITGLIGVIFVDLMVDVSETRFMMQINMLNSGQNIDLTTGRMDGYLIALKMIPENPFIGAGNIDLNDYGLGYRRVHNFYLRVALEFGLFFFFMISFFMICLTRSILMTVKHFRLLAFMTASLLLVPLLYEPSGLFGNFFVAGFLWFIIGVLSASKIKNFDSENAEKYCLA